MNATGKRLNRIIFILSLMGVLIALYVTQSFVRKTTIVCLNTGCEQVRKNPASYILGIPVPVFGLIGYSLMAILSFIRTTKTTINNQLLTIILGTASFGVLFVSWFTYTEIAIIRAICTWCAVSAVNMVTIWLLTIKSYKAQNNLKFKIGH